MSQDWNTDVYDKDARSADAIMQDVEKMFDTLQSSFSGGSAPSSPVAFQIWGDTSSGDECLKRRNDANSAWLAILCGDANQKMWIYRNDTCEGWVIDATVTDRVLAVKGGSNAYNASGGNIAGTWTFDRAYDHNHQWMDKVVGADDQSYDNNGSAVDIGVEGSAEGYDSISIGANFNINSDYYTANSVDSGSFATWRPAAAVGTLQYPDL